MKTVGSAFLTIVLLSLAFEFPALNFLVLVALIPWLLALRKCSGKAAFWSSAFFGGVTFVYQMWWVVPFTLRWTGNFGLSMVPYLVVIVLAAIVWSPLGWVVHHCFQRRQWWLIPLVWVSHDVLRAYLPELAFPWAYFGTPLVRYPELVQHAAWGMVYLVSATVIGINLALVSLWLKKKDDLSTGELNQGVILGAVSLALPMLAALRLTTPPPTNKKTFLMVQHGVDMAFSDHETRYDKIEEATEEALVAMNELHPDLAVFPEGYSSTTATTGPPVTPLGTNPPSPVIFGSFHQHDGNTYQAAYAFDGQWQSSDKTRLVVMGEFVPFRRFLPFLKQYNIGAADLTPGDTLRSLKVNGMQLGQMICFEGVFPDLGLKDSELGAQVFVQMSIDDWYAGTQAHRQLWESSVWRSIENGLPMVRVGSQGTSLVTDYRGRIQDVLPEGQRAIKLETVAIPDGSDAFKGRYLFVWLSVAAGILCFAYDLFNLIRRKLGSRKATVQEA